MDTAGSLGGELRTAIRTGSYKLALNVARAMPIVSIADALDLTLLAAEHDPDRFDAMAQRWLCRLVEERSLTLAEFAQAAAELQGVPMGLGNGDGLKTLLREKPLKGSISGV